MASSSTSSMSASPEALSQGTHQGEGGAESGEQRVFTCTVCFRNFNRLLHLQRHEYIHSDFKPFKCPWCPKSFTRQDSLVRHARLHCKKQEDTRNVSKALHKHKACMSCTDQGQCPRCAGYNRRPVKKKPPPMPLLSSVSPYPPSSSGYSPRQGSAPPRFTVGWRPCPSRQPLPTAGHPYASAHDTLPTRSATSLPTMTVNLRHRSPEPLAVHMEKSATLFPLDGSYAPVMSDRNIPFAAAHHTTAHFTRLDSPPHLNRSVSTSSGSPPTTAHEISTLPVSIHAPPVSPALTRHGTPFVAVPAPNPPPVQARRAPTSSGLPQAHPGTGEAREGVQGMLLDMLRTCEVMEHSLRSSPPVGLVPTTSTEF